MMGTAVRISGVTVLLVVGALLFYLVGEARNAFNQTFAYGHRVAAQASPLPSNYDLQLDPNASILSATPEGTEGLDEKEESLPPPSVFSLIDSPAGTAALLDGKEPGPETQVVLQDWQTTRRAEAGSTFRFFVFGSPQLQGDKMTLVWGPDGGFLPEYVPHKLRLRLVRAPSGITAPTVDIDLRKEPTGSLELPAFVAQTDEDIQKGYLFEITATPTTNSFWATLGGLLKTSWDPTSSYARYGAVPLFVATLIITLLSLLIAAPLGITAAVFISELAPQKLKEWLKPFIELLASVPTVVLAYFGITFVGPAFLEIVGRLGLAPAFGAESSRSLITVALVMGILLIPTIASVSEDALTNIPQSLRDGGDALGLTKFETLWKVLLPAAKSGLIGATLLGMARAIGETMVVWLLSGGTVRMPTLAEPLTNLGKPTKAVSDTIAIDIQNVSFGSVHYGHLFILATLLFIVTLVVNLTGYRIAKKAQWTH